MSDEALGVHDDDDEDLLAGYTASVYDPAPPLIPYLPDLDADFTSSALALPRRHTLDPVLDIKSELSRLRLAQQMSQQNLQRLSKAIRAGLKLFAPSFGVSQEDREEHDHAIAADFAGAVLTSIAARSNALDERVVCLERILVRRNNCLAERLDHGRQLMTLSIWKARFTAKIMMVYNSNTFWRCLLKLRQSSYLSRWRLQCQTSLHRCFWSHVALLISAHRQRHSARLFLNSWRLHCVHARNRSKARRRMILTRSWSRWVRAFALRCLYSRDQIQEAYSDLLIEHRAQQRFRAITACFQSWRSFAAGRKQVRALRDLKTRRIKALVFWRWLCVMGNHRATALRHCIDCGSVLRSVLLHDSEISRKEVAIQTDNLTESAPFVAQTDTVAHRLQNSSLTLLTIDPSESVARAVQYEHISGCDADAQTDAPLVVESECQTPSDDTVWRLERTIAMLRDQRDRSSDVAVSEMKQQLAEAIRVRVVLEHDNVALCETVRTMTDRVADLEAECAELRRRETEAQMCSSETQRLSSATRRPGASLSVQLPADSAAFHDNHFIKSIKTEAIFVEEFPEKPAEHSVVVVGKANEKPSSSSIMSDVEVHEAVLADTVPAAVSLDKDAVKPQGTAVMLAEEGPGSQPAATKKASGHATVLQSVKLEKAAEAVIAEKVQAAVQTDMVQEGRSDEVLVAQKELECANLRAQLQEVQSKCSSLERHQEHLAKDAAPRSSTQGEVDELRRQLAQAVTMCAKLRQIVFSLTKKPADPPAKRRARTDPDIHLSALSSHSATEISQNQPQAVARSACLAGATVDVDHAASSHSGNYIGAVSNDVIDRIWRLCHSMAIRLQIELPAVPDAVDEVMVLSTASTSDDTAYHPQRGSQSVSVLDSSDGIIVPAQSFELGEVRTLVVENREVFGACGSISDFCSRVRELLLVSDLGRRLRSQQYAEILGQCADYAELGDRVSRALDQLIRLRQDVALWEAGLRNRLAVELVLSPTDPSQVHAVLERIKQPHLDTRNIAVGTESIDPLLIEASSQHGPALRLQLEALRTASTQRSLANSICQLLDGDAVVAISAIRLQFDFRIRLRCFRTWVQQTRTCLRTKHALETFGDHNLLRLAAARFLRCWAGLIRKQRYAETSILRARLRRFFSTWSQLACHSQNTRQFQQRMRFTLLKTALHLWRGLCFRRILSRPGMSAHMRSYTASALNSFESIRRATVMSDAASQSTLMELPAAVVSAPELCDDAAEQAAPSDSSFHRFTAFNNRLRMRELRVRFWFQWRWATELSHLIRQYSDSGRSRIVLSDVVKFVSRRIASCNRKHNFFIWKSQFLKARLEQLKTIAVPVRPSSCDAIFIDSVLTFVAARNNRFRCRLRAFLRWRFVSHSRRRHSNINAYQSPHRNLKVATFNIWRNRCLNSWLLEAQQLDLVKSMLYQRHVTFVIWQMTARCRHSQMLALSHFRRNYDLSRLRSTFSAWAVAHRKAARRRDSVFRSLRLIRLLHIRKAWRRWALFPNMRRSLSEELMLNSLLQKVRQLRRQIELNQITSEIRAVDPVGTFCQQLLC